MPHPPTVLMTADAVGGVWTYAVSLCRALPEIHFVIATMGPRPGPDQQHEIAGFRNITLVQSDWRLEWMQGGVAELAASTRWLADLAAKCGADLVHVNGYAHASLYSALPTLLVAHSDVLSWWQAVHHCSAPAEWDAYRREVMRGLQAADRVVAPSAAVRADLQCHYGRRPIRAAVIPNGVELAGFTPLSKHPLVMAAGRVWDRAKGLDSLDRVAARLPWPVEIAGAAAHPEQGQAPLTNARPTGRLARSDMVRRLGEAAIFAAPARYEPFGLAILEAAASGCALVLGDIPSLREHWQDAAVFVDPEDENGLEQSLLQLMGDPAERRRLAAQARRRAQRFTAARMAHAYAALYRELRVPNTDYPSPAPAPAEICV